MQASSWNPKYTLTYQLNRGLDMPEEIWKTDQELYSKFGYSLVQHQFSDDDFIRMLREM
jgi:hypothetical protein